MFKLSMRTDNAAFSGSNGEDDKAYEVIRILNEIIPKIGSGTREGNVHDINGNNVGSWTLTNRK